MIRSRRRLVLPSLLALALAPFAAGAVLAQADQRYPAAGSERHASQQDGLFGGLFGRSEQPRREPVEAAQGRQAQMSAADITVRLDSLENQIRQLTGAIEQLQHRNQQLEQQVRRQQEDAEQRFQEMGGRGAPPPRRAQPQPAAQPAQPPPVAPAAVPQRRSDVFEPGENPGAPGAPQTLGSVPPRIASAPPPAQADEDAQYDPAGDRGAGAPLDLATLADRALNDPAVAPAGAPPHQPASARDMQPSTAPLPAPPARNPSATGGQRLASAPSATPRDEFALAQGYIQRRDYALAEESFREFLKKHPADRLVADAHHGLGESLFQRQRFRDAAESFLTVSTKYEKSSRAPDSLLRLGQSLAALGEREAACATLNEVGRKYPKASAGVKQTAEREQKRVRC